MSQDRIRQKTSPLPERFKLISGTDITEPHRDRDLFYRPWEAPALAADQNDEVRRHQDDVDQMLMAMLDQGLDKNTPSSVRNLIESLFFAKRLVLEGANKKGYENRVVADPRKELKGDLLAIHRKVMNGTATQWEIDLHRAAIKSASAELAMLRTVGDLRTEHEKPMMDETLELMGEGGRIGEPEKFEIVGYDLPFLQGKAMSAMRLRFKREFHGNRDDDVNVKSRHRLVVRTGKDSDFNQDVRRAMEDVVREGKLDTPLRLRRVSEAVTEIARTGSVHPLVDASMTSIYEVDPERDPTPEEEEL